MRKSVILLFLFWLSLANSVAQESKQPSTMKKIARTIEKALDDIAIKNVDTAYLALPEYGWKVAVTSNFAGVDASVKGHNIPTYQSIDINVNSNLNGQTAVMMGYRSLSASYSWNIAHGYSRDFNLAFLSKKMGIEYRNHTTDGLHGILDAAATEGNLPISKGDTRLKATIINGYYVFNSRKYSLPSAMKQSLIQKRSAGSVTAYALLLSARLESKNATVSTMLGGLKKIEFYQAAVGLGYGYNFTPNQGRLLIHASAAPLLVFYNKNFLTADVNIPLPDGSTYTTDINKEVKTKHRYFLTGVARASVFYNVNKHLYVGTAALVNDIRFNSASGVEMRMDDWVLNASLGVRF